MEQGIVQLVAPMLAGLLLEIIQLQGIVLLDMAACLFAMFMVMGTLTMIVTVVAYLYPRLRLVEDELPNAIPDDKVS